MKANWNPICMPALIGGFGKIVGFLNIMKKDFSSKSNEVIRITPKGSDKNITENTRKNSKSASKTGAYLAGLIEANPAFKIGAPNKKLNPFYVTGFLDAVGCFSVDVLKLNKNWSFAVSIQISLLSVDLPLLYEIQKFCGGIGSITISGKMAKLKISKLEDIISVIIPHFYRYPLQSAKLIDFNL